MPARRSRESSLHRRRAPACALILTQTREPRSPTVHIDAGPGFCVSVDTPAGVAQLTFADEPACPPPRLLRCLELPADERRAEQTPGGRGRGWVLRLNLAVSSSRGSLRLHRRQGDSRTIPENFVMHLECMYSLTAHRERCISLLRHARAALGPVVGLRSPICSLARACVHTSGSISHRPGTSHAASAPTTADYPRPCSAAAARTSPYDQQTFEIRLLTPLALPPGRLQRLLSLEVRAAVPVGRSPPV